MNIKQDIPTKAKGVIQNDLTKKQKAHIELSGWSTECKKAFKNTKV